MQSLRPWDNTVRILTGGWTSHPVPRGETFTMSEPMPIFSPGIYQRLFAFLMLMTVWLPKRVIR